MKEMTTVLTQGNLCTGRNSRVAIITQTEEANRFEPIRTVSFLKSKFPPQHPVLEHSQPLFLPMADRPSFTKFGFVFVISYYLN